MKSLPLREINIFGVFAPPAAVLLVLCAGAFLLVRWILLKRLNLNCYVWRRPLFEIACFVILYSIAVLSMQG